MKRRSYNETLKQWREQYRQLYGSQESETGTTLSAAEQYAVEQFAVDEEEVVRDHRDVRGT